jgi:hypothetical protein
LSEAVGWVAKDGGDSGSIAVDEDESVAVDLIAALPSNGETGIRAFPPAINRLCRCRIALCGNIQSGVAGLSPCGCARSVPARSSGKLANNSWKQRGGVKSTSCWYGVWTAAAGRAMAGLLAIFAEFEREILRERTRAGLVQARLNGKQLGRPVTAGRHATEIRRLYRAGIAKAEIARRLEIGRTSVRRILASIT